MEFTGDYFTVLKRGYAFIEQTITHLKNTQPLTEEDRLRMEKVKLEKAIFEAKKKEEEDYK